MLPIAPGGCGRRPGRCPLAASAAPIALAVALAAMLPASALAQPEQPTKPEAAPKLPMTLPEEDREIVVIGNRAIVTSLQDVPVEQNYNEDRVASYGVDSVGELLDAVTAENGDTEPSLLVNGRPVDNNNDISDFPVEAIARVEALPRGAATRVGGAAGQRAYNIVLKSRINTRIATVSYQLATEGAWHNIRGDGVVTYIKAQDRLNLSLRGGASDPLYEADRHLVPLPEPVPYSAFGNVIPSSGAEIDPALSLIAGTIVTRAGVPAGRSMPTLQDFAASANQINPSNLAQYRTLRGRTRSYDASASGNKTLAPWLSLSFNARLNGNREDRSNGLPSARFTLPSSNSFSPFSRVVTLAVNDPTRPLRNESRNKTAGLSTTLNATFKEWRATLNAKYDKRSRDYAYDLTGAIPSSITTIASTTNPFTGGLGTAIPVSTTFTSTDTSTSLIDAEVEGPLIALPAGPLRASAGVAARWARLDGANSLGTGDRRFRRHEYEGRASLSVPLTATDAGGLRALGNSDFSVDGAKADLGRYGSLTSLSLGLNWQPITWLRFSLSQRKQELAAPPELLAAPILTTQNVRYFDPITGETVEVTTISGGAANLKNQRLRLRRLSVTAAPWTAYNLQLGSDLLITDFYNQFGALPQSSPAVVAAFPERFRRDSSGRLTLVDIRTVNFDRQHSSELRTSIGFTIPLSRTAAPRAAAPRAPGVRSVPHKPTLQVNASFTRLLTNVSTIRKALGSIDLLSGGVIGLGGGRQRNAADANVTLSDRNIGIRANLTWRGRSFLVSGTNAAPDRLAFDAYAKLDIKLYADMNRLFGASPFTRGGRITLSVDNVLNDRQQVRNSLGQVPQSFQPVYRDPLGRTIMLEIRKSL